MLFSKKPKTNQTVPSGRNRRPQSAATFRQQGQGRAVPGQGQPRQRQQAAKQNPAFSYYAARSQSEINVGREAVSAKAPLRRLPGRLAKLRRHAGWLSLGLIAVGLAAFQLQLSTMPQVVVLSATSETPFLKPSDTYRDSAQQLFNASAANRNKLTVNTSAVSAELEQQFPELQQVSVSLPIFGNTPTVYIRPAAPALILAAANGTFIVDENGRALSAVTGENNPEGLKVPTITDQSTLNVTLGEQVLPGNVADFVMSIASQFEAKQIGIQSMTLPAAAGELDVYIAGQPYFVKFNIQDAGRESSLRQIGTYLVLVQQLNKSGNKPAQYVDVRLEGRAYYL